MGHSLDAIKFIVNLHVAIGSPFVDIHYKETYPFRDEDAYKQEVMEYRLKYDREELNKILKQHLSTCEEIIKTWGERLDLWKVRLRLIGNENEVDNNISYGIYCILGGRRNNIMRFYGNVMLLRNNNGKVEIGNPYTYIDMYWHEYDSETQPMPDTDKKTLTTHLVRFAEIIKRFLSEYISSEEILPPIEPQQLIDIPTDILSELENAKLITTEPRKWVGSVRLCAYFADKYFVGQTNKWEKTQQFFGVKNLAQQKDGYINSKSGKPRNHQIIDEILQKRR